MSYEQILIEDRRLMILKLLADSGGYTANEFLLQAALSGSGHAVAQDRLRTDLRWLTEQDLVTASEVAGLRIATLSGRGNDVAAGRTSVPGVKRPAPAG